MLKHSSGLLANHVCENPFSHNVLKTVECPHTPHLFRCFFCIPFSGLRVRNLYNRAKMRPRQIVNTRVHNLQIIETQIKLTEVIQIPLIERIAVFKRQSLCQCFNQPGTVLGTDFAMLFFLHDTPPDVPIGKYRNSIGRRVGLSPTLLYDIPNIIKKPCRTLFREAAVYPFPYPKF